ncbi:hypothetical protein ACFL9T_22995, partial [Thermodesulfobacteriota bacterium]
NISFEFGESEGRFGRDDLLNLIKLLFFKQGGRKGYYQGIPVFPGQGEKVSQDRFGSFETVR